MSGSVRVLSDISATKLAIEICNETEMKMEILCASGSSYDIDRRSLLRREVLPGHLRRMRKWTNPKDIKCESKIMWDEIVESKSILTLRNMRLPEKLRKKVMSMVSAIGMRMLIWAEYHEGVLGFSREYSVHFLKSSFFTQQGIIDSKKAAEELLKDKNLNLEQKYKVACLYCLVDHIPELYRQIKRNNKLKLYCTRSVGLIRFWSYYLMGKVDKITGGKTVDQYRLQTALVSGSKAAVEYCFEKTDLKSKDGAVIDAALEAVRYRMLLKEYGANFTDNSIIVDDWIVFGFKRYDENKELWVPSDYYVDILCFLLSKMSKDQQMEFLKIDIEGVNYYAEVFGDTRQSRVLNFFLKWPYQDYFMKMVGLVWEFLPERNYAILLLKICDRIEPEKERNLDYGGEESFDYRVLLKEFWCQSPEHFKRYVLSNQSVNYVSDHFFTVSACTELLAKLVTLKNFTHEDKDNVKLILASATDEEKIDIVSSYHWTHFCIELMRKGDWKPLNRFVLICFSSLEETDKFKRGLICAEDVQSACIDLIKNDKCDAVESFIKWCALPEEEIREIKREVIYSGDGKHACIDVIDCEGLVAVNRFIRWYFSSEEEVKTFKKELIFSDRAVFMCARLIKEDKLEFVNKFVNLCLSSGEDIREFKKNVGYRKGSLVLESMIFSYSAQVYDKIMHHSSTKCKDFKWEEAEKILTWFFSSEDEINDFKKNVLLQESGKEIHFLLIESNLFEEAENFFAWLGLSAQEIKELKKDTLFHHESASSMFSQLMHSKEVHEICPHYGSKREAIEKLLRWYLTDKETVLEFKDKFKSQYHGEVTEEDKAMLEKFDLMIEQRLWDLDKKQMGVKRKSEAFSRSKKLCN